MVSVKRVEMFEESASKKRPILRLSNYKGGGVKSVQCDKCFHVFDQDKTRCPNCNNINRKSE